MKNFFKLMLLSVLVSVTACKKDNDQENHANPNKLGTGASANDYLSAEKFESINIEVLYSAGYAPPTAALNTMKSFLAQYCNKPGGITISTRQLNDAVQEGYSLDDVRGIEDNNRTVFNNDKTLGMFVFMAGGDYVQDSDTLFTLGIAYRNTSCVVYQRTIKDRTGGIGEPSEATVTGAILNHEVGHLLGLVNIGSNMVSDHEDNDHENHCDNEECLMYWALTSANSMGLFGGNIPALDANCEADLKANGGK